ncbi:PepSY-associated TM helix domain-containing protein [Neptunicella marina]|uniref:PepSY-associated TM helix domain-containing protein n=1 Tax=Neptunicella marina TaxID=2125989 RepID=A0A8J6IS92_9ALTE|nr:PepSY-associated TM helix domain-containing protein [Neptunicella marina]MBC3764772.1 PepSY-associated TM helix domain-containing protein [Neptunicella marina]
MSFGSIRQWHWISSAICLAAMLMFSVTGITLNHAADIPADVKINTLEFAMPEQLLDELQNLQQGPLPTVIVKWLAEEKSLYIKAANKVEWNEDELYLSLPEPGGDAWMSIDRYSGDVVYERTTRGVVAYLNDLHKGRNTGKSWMWFIDIFAIACVVFCLTGFVLLYRYAGARPTTWPMVGLGVLLPVIVVILFVHP